MEIDKLLEARFIKEVKYPDWLANMVVFPKKMGKRQVCIDYTNLNDVYPKNIFYLPQIDQIVNVTARHGMLSFLNTFSRYHQIPMFSSDEKKTVFVTPQGLYCYKVMSFELKNASATYQRLITQIFKPLIDRTMEVYIDDIIMKSETRAEHAQHLEKAFCLIQAYNMKLNLAKCVFKVNVGKFLRFMVTKMGIEINLIQVKVVLKTLALSSKKELQHLICHLVVLGRFITLFTDKL